MLDKLMAFYDPMVLSVELDLSGQAAFEAGVLLWETALGKHPINSYPVACLSGPMHARSHTYTRASTCVLTAADRAGLAAAGYPVDEFVTLVQDLVSCDPRLRPRLSDASERFDRLLHPTCRSLGLQLVRVYLEFF